MRNASSGSTDIRAAGWDFLDPVSSPPVERTQGLEATKQPVIAEKGLLCKLISLSSATSFVMQIPSLYDPYIP